MPKKNAKAQKSNELDGAEFFAAINLIEKEKGIPKAYMLEKITQALVSAYKRDHEGAGDNVTVEADEEAGTVRMFVKKDVVEEVDNPCTEMSLQMAREKLPHAQLGEGDLDNHRKGRLKKLAHVGLEHALVIVDQAHAGQGHPYPQNQNLQPPHKELEVEDKVHDNEHQPKDSSHKAECGDAGHPARPIVSGGKADGLQHFIAHFFYNRGKPVIHGGKADCHSHSLEKVCENGNRLLVGVPV